MSRRRGQAVLLRFDVCSACGCETLAAWLLGGCVGHDKVGTGLGDWGYVAELSSCPLLRCGFVVVPLLWRWCPAGWVAAMAADGFGRGQDFYFRVAKVD